MLTKSEKIDADSIRRTVRLIHCIQKERGASCAASASLRTLQILKRKNETNITNDIDFVFNEEELSLRSSSEDIEIDSFNKVEKNTYLLLEAVESARINTDAALSQLMINPNSASEEGGFNYGGGDSLPLRESLTRVRCIIDPSLFHLRGKLEMSHRSNNRRLFIAFNTLISNIIHTQIVRYVSALKKGDELNKQRASSFILEKSSPKVQNTKTLNRQRCVSTQDVKSDLHGSMPLLYNATFELKPVTQKKKFDSKSSPSLLTLLIVFIRLKESTGIERALLSILLALPNKKESDKEKEYFVNNLVLEIENQRQLNLELKQQAKLLTSINDENRVLVALVEQSIILSPELKKIHNLIKTQFDVAGFQMAVQLDIFWKLISVYIDKLHALELLIIEELASAAFKNARYFNLNKNNSTIQFQGIEPKKDESPNASDRYEKDSTVINIALGLQQDISQQSLFEAREQIKSFSPQYLQKCILSMCNDNGHHIAKPKVNGSSSCSVNDSLSPEKRSRENAVSKSMIVNNSENEQKDLYRRESAPIILSSRDDKEDWMIDLYEVKFLRRIGRGIAGTTYLGSWRGESVAIKVAAMTEVGLFGWESEIASLKRLHHPNIIRLLGSIVSKTPQTNCLVLEYCDGGDLTDAMNNPTPANFFQHVVKSMANGMAYLHRKEIIHRDIKPDNVVLHGNVKSGHYVVKLTDFGLATLGAQRAELTAETGTYRWMSPEVIKHEPYSYKADVYSFAIVAWQLLTRELPFAGINQVQAANMVAFENFRPPFPDKVPVSIRKLIESCWYDDPEKRTSFEKILALIDKIFNELKIDEKEWVQNPNGHPVYSGVIDDSTGSPNSHPENTDLLMAHAAEIRSFSVKEVKKKVKGKGRGIMKLFVRKASD